VGAPGQAAAGQQQGGGGDVPTTTAPRPCTLYGIAGSVLQACVAGSKRATASLTVPLVVSPPSA
jgi:hypothetical protein